MYLLMDIIVNLFRKHMHQKARNWDIYIHMHEAIRLLLAIHDVRKYWRTYVDTSILCNIVIL